MKRQVAARLTKAFAIAAGVFLVGACSTPETRISERPEVYQSLSATDQALVTQGKIREGMSRDAVYLAWGAPNQRGSGRNRGSNVENWIYFSSTSSGYYGGPYRWGYGYGGLGFGGYAGSYLHPHRSGRLHRHVFYDPFYDPFFWRYNSVVTYPERTVSFQNGRVIAYQFLPAPRVY
ncbi:hypothetical protein BH18VER1_BH18VER1_21960 [soil metagenome]